MDVKTLKEARIITTQMRECLIDLGTVLNAANRALKEIADMKEIRSGVESPTPASLIASTHLEENFEKSLKTLKNVLAVVKTSNKEMNK